MKKSLLDELIVEVDGVTYLVRRRSAEVLETPSTVKGSKWLLSDFGGAPPKFLSVESPARYAEIVAQRRLLEIGESGEHARICSHWKKARGKTSTELFFTVVEGDVYNTYEDRAFDDSQHHLLFSLNALMYACLREHSKNKTVLVLFEHDRHVDLLLGRSGQVLATSRVSSYAYTPEAKENQTETVRQELKAMMAEMSGKLELIVHFSWLLGVETESATATAHSSTTGSSGFSSFGQLDTKEVSTSTGWAATGESSAMGKEQARLMSAEWGHKMAKSLEVPFKQLKPKMYDLKGNEFVVSALTEAMSYLTVADSSSSRLDRFQYQAQRSMPWMTLSALLMISGLYLGGLWMQQQANILTDETMKLTDLSMDLSMKVDPVDPAYLKVVTFADQVSQLKTAPSLQGILTDISNSLSGKMLFDKIIVEYDDRAKVLTTLKGRIKSGFQQASQEHEAFITGLTSRNFRVVKSDFSTDVTELQFTLKLERE